MKYCTKCGQEVMEEAVVCPHCGCEVKTPKKDETNGMAIAGFVCSFFIPLLGWIFGGLGLKKSKETNKGRGLSVAALIISTVSFVGYLCMLLI